jgi:hypothetical protein
MSYASKALAAASALLVGAPAVFAGNVTLQGNCVKIGTSDRGTIGSMGNTSPGILYDSTCTGTFNPSYDYLTPGNPFEGWTIKGVDTDGTTVIFTNTNNNNGSPVNVTGTNVDYSGVSYRGVTFDHRAVWSGSTTNYNVEHDVRFNSNQHFVDINTRLEFLINVPTLYFGRFTDPDARAAAGDSSATLNTRGYAGGIPVTNVVLSEALTSKYALGLFTGATNSNTGVSAAWTTDPVQYYNGVTSSAQGDHTIGLGFMFSGVNAGDIINIQYAYIFGPSAFAAGSTAVAGGAGGSTPSTFTVVDAGSASAPTTPSAPTITGTSTTNTVTSSTSSSTRTETSYVTRTVNSTDADGNPVVRTYVDTVVTTIPVTTTTTTTTPVTTTTYSDSSTTSSSGTPVVTTSTSDGTGTSVVTATVLDATAVTRTVTTSSSASSSTTGTRTVTRTVTDTDTSGNPRTRTYTDTVLDTTPVTTTTTTSTPVTTIYHADSSTTVVEGTSVSSSSSSNGTTSSSVIATTLDSTAVTRPSVSSSSVQSSTLPVVSVTLTEHNASENKGVQKIARHHATTTTTPMVRTVVTTPVTTATNSNGTETTSNGTPVITYELWNDVGITHVYDNLFGRVDQLEVLDGINDGINGLLNHEPTAGKQRLRVFENNRFVQSYNADGYKADSKIFGGGFEFDVTKGWTLGFQYNRVNINLNGVDSRTQQNKDHFGVFSELRGNTFTLNTNAAIANSNYKYNRTVEGIFNNEGSTTGSEWWISNRLYWHLNKSVKPFIGYTVQNVRRNAYNETGSIQSARSVETHNQTTHIGEVGLKLETRFGGKKNNLFGVSVEGSYGTDSSYDVTASVDYKEMLFIEGSHGVNNGVTNNSVAAKVKFRF